MSTKKSPSSTADARPLALIAGPTASGKSANALDLAKELEKSGRTGVIINADSMQVYADIPILSAAPSAEERDVCEHRLYGTWDGAEACSAADWAARAKAEIEDCHASGLVPILVGGTGMYLKVLLEGIAPIPEIEPEVREVVRAMEKQVAYAALQIEDPVRAAELEPGDTQRIARALEVKRSTGVTLGDWQQAKTGGLGDEVSLHAIVMMPERQWVYDRCDVRFAAMVDSGAVEEVEALLARDLSPDLPVMRAIGVPEIAAMIRGEATKEEAIEAGARSTRQYAKRQFTWLRNQCPEDWNRVESQNIDTKSIFAGLFQT
ncbi:tRNA (adenosine(37)-N6)-dimethylallyltransferase MiaA [Erythrobacter sp. KY5]|uniref:tRNA (adenosine(37)-N6)-dimethylallyltransferase MiaA n=1 Tax=Erythrobacter sp. KY5 TaxID=2011159 RepID=UPI000DBF2C8E|nr:tRNA (adenosine(37)-N6)-dimethylallyltransferase MiaA [Erythrobacter sp. KY5]AWW74638.1 tRNA (adenosine(37)-N6)-dimethylallyltransferase MiaA [Erythrobacter sp. KY5]